jgi:type I restriction enzyme S subunit
MSDVTLSPQDLPPTWAITTLGAVVDYGRTSKAEPTAMQASDWILELEDIEKDRSRLLRRLTFGERQSKSTKSRFEAGDVLYGKLRPYLNKVLIADQSGYCTTEIIPIKSGKYLDSRYLFYWLKHPAFLAYVGAESHGMNMPRLGTDTGRAAPFVLAPCEEQKRISDQLETLLARVNACNDRLDAIPGILKRFRQAVLDLATLGKLTQGWRESNGLPFVWQSVQLKDIADVQGGIAKNSRKQSLVDEDVPYLRVANVQRGYIDLTEVKTIRVPAEKLEGLLLESGDILFNEGGDLDKLGRGWVWEGQIPRCTFQNHVFCARLHDMRNQPKFISWWGNSRSLEYFLRSGKQTTNLASINKTMLAALPIQLPPFDEQVEIVRRVEALFNLADRIEARLTTARTHAHRLAPRVLAKAFRGELVPQDPSDEPASALLARITSERTIASTSPKNTAVRKSRAPRAAGATKETATMTKSRHDDDVKGKPYLADHLHRIGKAVTAEELFKAAELPIADFYKQLAWEVEQGHVTNGGDTLEARDAA